ncbi:MAG: MoaD/ThiS family protein [Deltaproteobacteria bacterium]|nr:MoaD/ThiS family protein [Deltaproteobacteria bacterium]
MKVTIKLFANLKDLAGTSEVEMDLQEGTKINDFMQVICGKFPSLKDIIETRKIFISINQEMAGKEDSLNEGDEVGLLPPFSGG